MCYRSLQEGSAFLQDVIANLEASKQPDTQQPVLYLRMQLAQYALVQGRLQVRSHLRGGLWLRLRLRLRLAEGAGWLGGWLAWGLAEGAGLGMQQLVVQLAALMHSWSQGHCFCTLRAG